jgi:hypothetical protein
MLGRKIHFDIRIVFKKKQLDDKIQVNSNTSRVMLIARNSIRAIGKVG